MNNESIAAAVIIEIVARIIMSFFTTIAGVFQSPTPVPALAIIKKLKNKIFLGKAN